MICDCWSGRYVCRIWNKTNKAYKICKNMMKELSIQIVMTNIRWKL